MVDIVILRQRLTEAELALHRLSLGTSVVSITDGERKITYTAGNIGQLRNYIDDLKRQIAALENPVVPRRGPFVISF
ncbi:gpW family head-tail joining protein [Microvirga zambiensis]|uniref:gpW family head-tail joining protein n=1 Tax=Microvirga zambiensis TaxID=1402137 RepID=UPI00191E70EE|nr:gpW family head-tail joining protein [Microvirga zambiensis]